MTYEDWVPIAKIVEDHNLIVLSDEIYAELTYNHKHVSFASLPGMKERTLLISVDVCLLKGYRKLACPVTNPKEHSMHFLQFHT
jgi:hypothetical protein